MTQLSVAQAIKPPRRIGLRQYALVAIGLVTIGLYVGAARGGNLLINIKTYLIVYVTAFGLMAVAFALLRQMGKRQWWTVLAFAVVFRAVMVFAPPTLSDDIYRYVWDGRLSASGVNPYLYRPDAPELAPRRDDEIYFRLSSWFVYSVYPPVSQFVFFLGAQTDEPIRAIKIMFAAFDLGVVLLLWSLLNQFGLPRRNVVLYAWNPLPIFEFGGSGHIDSALLFFLMLALWCYARQRYFSCATALGLAVITKLFPLVFIPFFMLAVRGRWRYGLPLWAGVVALLGYLPFAGALPTVLKNFATSGRMYFNYYIFNGSLFTFGWWVRDTFQVYRRYTDLDFMAQVLSILFGVVWLALLVQSWLRRNEADTLWLARRMLIIFFAFLVCGHNIQVWYVSWTLCLAMLFVDFDRPVGNDAGGLWRRLPYARLSWLSWSLTCCFAYLAYYQLMTKTGPYAVPAWATWLEYGSLFGLLFVEWVCRRRAEAHSYSPSLPAPEPSPAPGD